MGYRTDYKLQIIYGDNGITDYKKEIIKLSGYDYLFEGQNKWYVWEEQMRKYSKNHPDTLFMLIGIGEENGDQWHAYFKNGLMQKCEARIYFDQYNESQLE